MRTSTKDTAKWLADLYETSQKMMRLPPAVPDEATKADPAPFTAMTGQFAQLQEDYAKQMGSLWSGVWGLPQATEAPGAQDDKRFAGEAWKLDPRYDLLKRTYLAYSDFLQRAIDAAPLDDQSKPHLHFATRQFTEAISPANFFATNPEAIQLATETGGRSVFEGMTLFLDDLAKGRITMTDESAFEVGTNLAVTKGAVVFENELIQLIQYAPSTEQVYARPLVMIPPCINKFYILDLQPENSFVRYAVEQGHTVFLVSWRNVSSALGSLTWDDYLELGVIQAIDVALEITKADRVNTLGFCVGGTLLASALAVMAEWGEDKVASMTLLTTMLDYSDTGEIGLLVSEASVAAREQAIGKHGLLQGRELGFVFSSLRANDLIWQYVSNSYLKGKAPPAFDMLYWNSDATNLPGPMFCWYVRNTYLENNLREAGRTVSCGTPVDLTRIKIPAYVYASRDDHIVPWRTAYASRELLGGDTTFVLGASGHIAGVINSPSKNKRNYWVLGGDGKADEWLAAATSIPGSWWPDWSGWLAWHAGSRMPAGKTLGSKRYRMIEPAPGRYVKEKDS
jgi:polyhydroxyalkanoate synthase